MRDCLVGKTLVKAEARNICYSCYNMVNPALVSHNSLQKNCGVGLVSSCLLHNLMNKCTKLTNMKYIFQNNSKKLITKAPNAVETGSENKCIVIMLIVLSIPSIPKLCTYVFDLHRCATFYLIVDTYLPLYKM